MNLTDQTLCEILTVLKQIRTILAAQVEDGFSESGEIVIGTLPVTVPFDKPFFTILIINDGPGDLEYVVPAKSGNNYNKLESTERITVPYSRAVIDAATFRTVSGGSCKIRWYGTY